MPVLYLGELVGRIERGGPAGAQVQLVTDLGFRVTGRFGRAVRKSDSEFEFQPTATEIPLVEGIGRGMMIVDALGPWVAARGSYPGSNGGAPGLG